MPRMTGPVDLAVVGAGAAGLMAAIWARRTAPDRSVVLLDGARTLGAKILVSGGGRCNVTHQAVDETAFAGSSAMPSSARRTTARHSGPAPSGRSSRSCRRSPSRCSWTNSIAWSPIGACA